MWCNRITLSCHFWSSQGALCGIFQRLAFDWYTACNPQLYQSEQISFIKYHGKGSYLGIQLLHQWHE
jgi:hypothetical protein